MLAQRIGLIGAGQMATALGLGFIRAGLLPADRLLAADPQPDARTSFAKETGGQATADNAEVVAQADVLILAVKPQQIAGVLAELRGKVPARTLVVSIVAGFRLAALAEGLGPQTRLVRVMPNTPCLVGRGACALLPRRTGDCRRRPVGRATARRGRHRLSGRREAAGRRDGAVGLRAGVRLRGDRGPQRRRRPHGVAPRCGHRLGRPNRPRRRGQMVLATGEHPGVLKDRVASPGGTTIAGLQAIEEGGLRATLMAAVEAATRRSIELGTSS